MEMPSDRRHEYSKVVSSLLAERLVMLYQTCMPHGDLQRARDLMTEALTLCDALGESLAGARLQYALDTLPGDKTENRVREDRHPWRESE